MGVRVSILGSLRLTCSMFTKGPGAMGRSGEKILPEWGPPVGALPRAPRPAAPHLAEDLDDRGSSSATSVATMGTGFPPNPDVTRGGNVPPAPCEYSHRDPSSVDPLPGEYVQRLSGGEGLAWVRFLGTIQFASDEEVDEKEAWKRIHERFWSKEEACRPSNTPRNTSTTYTSTGATKDASRNERCCKAKGIDELTAAENERSCRHVVLPPEVAKLLPKGRLLSEAEWRGMGVQQSRGWVHYAIHRPEPHIMLFRRPLNYQQQNANPNINK